MPAVPACLDVPPSYAAKARYALEELLRPLGLAPEFVTREDLADGLYYGPNAAGLPRSVVRLGYDPEAPALFECGEAVPDERVRWLSVDGIRYPVLFGAEEAPDFVASAFFWLSGWQEHTTTARDEHGRFPHALSLQSRLGTTTRPAVDAYRAWLVRRLKRFGPETPGWHGRPFAVCPTHDIDYVRKGRPGLLRRAAAGRTHGGLGAALRQAVSTGDPFREALRRLPEETEARGGRGTYFFKTGATGELDHLYRLTAVREALARLRAGGHEVGLHPSYHAHAHARQLHHEKVRLEDALATPVATSRTHYLRWHSPATPRTLAEAGLRLDSTLGFAEAEGWRHGTCFPFRLYDLHADAPLDLWELPLALMDVAVFHRRGLSPEEAVEAANELLATARRFGGVVVFLWHNTVWDEVDYPGWGRHLTEVLDLAHAQDAWIAPLGDVLDSFLNETSARARRGAPP